MIKRSELILQGMKELCVYVNRSEATVLRWIRYCGFPAAKLDGSTWEADRELVDQWRKGTIETDKGRMKEPAAAQKGKQAGGKNGRPRKNGRKAAYRKKVVGG